MAQPSSVNLSTSMVALLKQLSTPDARLVIWHQFPLSYVTRLGFDPTMVEYAVATDLKERGLVCEMLRDDGVVVYVLSDAGQSLLHSHGEDL